MAKPKTKPQPKRKGRPPKIVADEKTLATLAGLAKIQCTDKEAAAVLGVSVPTFAAFLARDIKARETWENSKELGKASLRRTQFKLAETNVVMAIWLGKQLLGQRDKIEQEHTGSVDVNLVEVRNGIESKLGRIAAAGATRQVARVAH